MLLQTNEVSDILLKILKSDGPFMLLLQQQSLPSLTICYILAVLARVCSSPTENQRTLLNRFSVEIMPQTVTDNHFLVRHLLFFIAKMHSTTAATYPDRNLYTKAVHDLLIFMRGLQITMPTASINLLQAVMPLLQSQIDYLNKKENCFKREVVELLNEILAILEAKPLIGGAGNEISDGQIDVEQPPQDFRTIAICPKFSDIFIDQLPFVRSNHINGKYAGGINHYLDVQFRLLREDFVRPLREGIQEYVQRFQSGQKNFTDKIRDVRVYQDIRIENSDFDNGELIFVASFNTKQLRHIQWKVNIALKLNKF